MSAIDDNAQSTRSVTSGWIGQYRQHAGADKMLWITVRNEGTLSDILDWVQHERAWDAKTAEVRFVYRAFHPQLRRSILV